MSRNHSIAWASAALIVIMMIAAGCQQQDQNRLTAPGSASDLANFYASRGLGTGQIGGYVKAGEFVLNLPTGHWRVTYTMPDGNEYTKYAVLDQESLCYFGTYSDTVVQVEVEQGEFTDDGSSIPLSNVQHLFPSGIFSGWGVIVLVIINSEVNTAGSSGIVVVLIPKDVVYPPLPASAKCKGGGFLHDGKCWYKCQNQNTCTQTCKALNGQFDATALDYLTNMADNAARQTACGTILNGLGAAAVPWEDDGLGATDEQDWCGVESPDNQKNYGSGAGGWMTETNPVCYEAPGFDACPCVL